MLKKHYFLLATQVVYQKDKLERNKPLNILITSEEATVNRSQLGRGQQQAQVRFLNEFDTARQCTILDVFIQSVSYLGHMTDKEFHAEFYVEPPTSDEETSANAPAVAEETQTSASVDPRYGTDDQNKEMQDRGE